MDWPWGLRRRRRAAKVMVAVGEAVTHGEAERVIGWREHVLVEAGYALHLATRIAEAPHVDLHDAVQLLKDGCPPDTAAEILC